MRSQPEARVQYKATIIGNTTELLPPHYSKPNPLPTSHDWATSSNNTNFTHFQNKPLTSRRIYRNWTKYWIASKCISIFAANVLALQNLNYHTTHWIHNSDTSMADSRVTIVKSLEAAFEKRRINGADEFNMWIATIAPPRDAAGPRALSPHMLTCTNFQKTLDRDWLVDLQERKIWSDNKRTFTPVNTLLGK